MIGHNYSSRRYERALARAAQLPIADCRLPIAKPSGRSLAGKIYLPSDNSPTTASLGAIKGEAVDSQITVPAASAGAETFTRIPRIDTNSETPIPISDDSRNSRKSPSRPTVAKLGLRYER